MLRFRRRALRLLAIRPRLLLPFLRILFGFPYSGCYCRRKGVQVNHHPTEISRVFICLLIRVVAVHPIEKAEVVGFEKVGFLGAVPDTVPVGGFYFQTERFKELFTSRMESV